MHIFFMFLLFILYICLEDISNTVSEHLTKKYGNKKIEIIEANPGPCLITQHLLEKTNYNICVYENNYNVFKEFLMVSVTFFFIMSTYFIYSKYLI